MLDIDFIKGPVEKFGEPVMVGEIIVGDHKETFFAPLVYWSLVL